MCNQSNVKYVHVCFLCRSIQRSSNHNTSISCPLLLIVASLHHAIRSPSACTCSSTPLSASTACPKRCGTSTFTGAMTGARTGTARSDRSFNLGDRRKLTLQGVETRAPGGKRRAFHETPRVPCLILMFHPWGLTIPTISSKIRCTSNTGFPLPEGTPEEKDGFGQPIWNTSWVCFTKTSCGIPCTPGGRCHWYFCSASGDICDSPRQVASVFQ